MTLNTTLKALTAIALLITLTACAETAERLKYAGGDPPIEPVVNPVDRPSYQPVSLPMPAQRHDVQQENSLWVSGRRSFFKDQRASQVGDILTVTVDIADNATLENKSEKTKSATQNASVPGLFGFQKKLTQQFLPNNPSATNLLDTSSDSSDTGKGKIERDEAVEMKVAAVITQILPNGNMVIHGKQQVRVSNERRDLEVAGIIRPEDITTQNSVPYEKIAEARIVYGGQGMVTDANRPHYGNDVVDALLPF